MRGQRQEGDDAVWSHVVGKADLIHAGACSSRHEVADLIEFSLLRMHCGLPSIDAQPLLFPLSFTVV